MPASGLFPGRPGSQVLALIEVYSKGGCEARGGRSGAFGRPLLALETPRLVRYGMHTCLPDSGFQTGLEAG